jgi:ribosomal protein S18 acetylase RimI-like enzyme
MPSTFRVVPIAEEHIAGFHAAVDSVARELLYLLLLEAPPIETTREFVRGNIAAGTPQFVALDGNQVVGWCDVTPKSRPSQAHCGMLGMAVIEPYRGRGIGKALLDATLKAARAKGMTRVELTVRADNEKAKRLYESFGFAVEGTCRRHVRIKGEYSDSYYMALLFQDTAT